jgi:hypothetical protein
MSETNAAVAWLDERYETQLRDLKNATSAYRDAASCDEPRTSRRYWFRGSFVRPLLELLEERDDLESWTWSHGRHSPDWWWSADSRWRLKRPPVDFSRGPEYPSELAESPTWEKEELRWSG